MDHEAVLVILFEFILQPLSYIVERLFICIHLMHGGMVFKMYNFSFIIIATHIDKIDKAVY